MLLPFLLARLLCVTVDTLIKPYQRRTQLRRLRALRLDEVDSMPGLAFEHYVARLLEHQGFKASVTKGSGDLGIDIIAHKNDRHYAVQCKRYNGNIPRNAVSDAVAGKQHYRCGEAMVVTNRFFTPGAKQLARSTRCALVDRDTLALWVQSFQSQSVPHNLVQRIKDCMSFINIPRVFAAVLAFTILLVVIHAVTILFFAR